MTILDVFVCMYICRYIKVSIHMRVCVSKIYLYIVVHFVMWTSFKHPAMLFLPQPVHWSTTNQTMGFNTGAVTFTTTISYRIISATDFTSWPIGWLESIHSSGYVLFWDLARVICEGYTEFKNIILMFENSFAIVFFNINVFRYACFFWFSVAFAFARIVLSLFL